MTDVVNPKSTSPDQLLPYHKKISAEGKALMKCFISYTYMVLKGSADFGELLNIGGTSSKTLYGPKNIYQPDEIEKFLDFAEAFRVKLEQRGYKLDKWKR